MCKEKALLFVYDSSGKAESHLIQMVLNNRFEVKIYSRSRDFNKDLKNENVIVQLRVIVNEVERKQKGNRNREKCIRNGKEKERKKKRKR